MRYLGIEVDDALAVPGKSTSELPGQSGPALPIRQGRVMLGSDSPMEARRPELRLPLGTPLGGP